MQHQDGISAKRPAPPEKTAMAMVGNRQRPGSIRNRILLFSILVTLVPSIGMGWFWHDISRKTTTASVEQKLNGSADLAEREISLWFKERNYDLRVFASSFVVTENLALYHRNIQDGGEETPETEAALRKISTYLHIILPRFTSYHRLSVLNGEGKVLAASQPIDQEKYVVLPENWQEQVGKNRYFLGDYFFTDEKGQPLALIGIPLSGNTDTVIGFFVLEVYLDSIRSLLHSLLPDRTTKTGCITLLEKNGRIIFRVPATQGATTGAEVLPVEILDLFKRPRVLREYVGNDRLEVLGMAFSPAQLPWFLLLEENKEDVYAGLRAARNKILLFTILLTIGIGGGAVIISRQIITPLQALTTAVLQVANGDLKLEVPGYRNDELGLVSRMFNEMVDRLRENQSRLEQLATTDPLTGLVNRKQIMADLDRQMEGFRRHATDFAVLMLDIDYFKKVNDRYGHQAGDAVLIGVAEVLRRVLRVLDVAGRYGGEEFLVILEMADLAHAVQTAERLREAVEQLSVPWQDYELQVTVSIGVAAISADDRSAGDLIGRVDKALYRAKDEGRNRVCLPKTS